MRSVKLLSILLLPLFSMGQNGLSQCDSLMIKRDFEAATVCLENLYAENPVGTAYQKLLEAYLILEESSKVL